MYICMHALICMHINLRICAYVYSCMNRDACIMYARYILYVRMHVYTCLHIGASMYVPGMYVCMLVCKNKSMRVLMDVSTYLCMYVALQVRGSRPELGGVFHRHQVLIQTGKRST